MMIQVRTTMVRTKAATMVLLLCGTVLAGCTSDGSGEGLSGLGDRITNVDSSKPVSEMKQPRIDATTFTPAAAVPRTGAPAAPKTFFFADPQADPTLNPQSNYFYAEQNKAIINTAGQVVPVASIRQYLHGIADRLLATGPKVDIPAVQVHISANPFYNASAELTGDIYLSIGALNLAQSEDEIAVLMGHELAHLLLAHHDRQQLFHQQRKLTQGAVETAVVGGYLLASGKSGTLFKDNGGVPTAAAVQAGKDGQRLQAAKMGIDFIGNDVVGASWSRANEDEADQLGIDLAVAAGYDPYEIQAFLDRLAEAAAKRQTYLARLDKNAAGYTAALEKRLSSGDFSIEAIMATGIQIGTTAAEAVGRDVRDHLRRQHGDAEDRKERSDAYITKFYSDADPRPTQDYGQTKQRYGVPNLYSAYLDVDRARGQVENGDNTAALATLNGAYGRASIRSHSFPRMVEAQAREGNGDLNGAIAVLEGGSSGAPLPVGGMLKLASLYAATGNEGSAYAALDRAERLYGVEAVIPDRIAVAATLGRTEKAQQVLVDCRKLSKTTADRCEEFAAEKGLIEQSRGGFLAGLLNNGTNPSPAAGTGAVATPGSASPVPASATQTEPTSPAGILSTIGGGIGKGVSGIGSGLGSLLGQ